MFWSMTHASSNVCSTALGFDDPQHLLTAGLVQGAVVAGYPWRGEHPILQVGTPKGVHKDTCYLQSPQHAVAIDLCVMQ